MIVLKDMKEEVTIGGKVRTVRQILNALNAHEKQAARKSEGAKRRRERLKKETGKTRKPKSKVE